MASSFGARFGLVEEQDWIERADLDGDTSLASTLGARFGLVDGQDWIERADLDGDTSLASSLGARFELVDGQDSIKRANLDGRAQGLYCGMLAEGSSSSEESSVCGSNSGDLETVAV